MPTPSRGEDRKEFICRCVPYVLKEPNTKSADYAYAKCLGIWESHQLVANQKRDVLRGDPSRTRTLRDAAERDIRKRMRALTKAIIKLIVEEDALGMQRQDNLAINTRWKFRNSDQKIEEFDRWLKDQFNRGVLAGVKNANGVIEWIEKAYKKGVESAYKAVKRPILDKAVAVFQGGKEQFIQTHITGPVSVNKLKLLQTRVFTDLKNVGEGAAKRLENVLVDALVQGKQPYEIVKDIEKAVGVESFRAETIARTEIVRANAEGNLDALEALGVEEVAVLVEWSTAGDQRVCNLCSALEGIVLKIKESHNLIPRHPNCRCAFIPANVGEDTSLQVRSKEEVEKRLEESIRREKPGISPEVAREKSKWGGSDFVPDRKNKDELEGYGALPTQDDDKPVDSGEQPKRKRKSKKQLEKEKQEQEEALIESQLDERQKLRIELEKQAKAIDDEIEALLGRRKRND